MNDYAYFYNSKDGDRKYDADSFSNWLKQLFTDGVISGADRIQAGFNGRYYIHKRYGYIGICSK